MTFIGFMGRDCIRCFRLHVMLAGLVMLLCFSPASGSSEDDLLRFLVEQNSAAQNRLRSYSYTIKVQWNKDGDKTPPVQSEGQVKRDGLFRWSTYRRTAFNKTAGKIEKREMRLVVNDKYAAFWPDVGNPSAYQKFHSSFETMDQRTKTRCVLQAPLQVLSYCFGGSEGGTFRETMAKYPSMKFDAISVKGADGKTVYQIRRFMPTMDDASMPDAVWVLDPEKGFLVTENIAYRANGERWIHRKIKVKQVEPGVWFPASFEEKRYGASRKSAEAKAVTQWHQAQLTDIVVTPRFLKEQFEISALRLKEDRPDIVVIRTDLDGKSTQYGYLGDNLVPKDLKDLANDKQTVNNRIQAMNEVESMASPASLPAAGSRGTTKQDMEPPSSSKGQWPRTFVWIGFVAACVGFVLVCLIIIKLLRKRPESEI